METKFKGGAKAKLPDYELEGVREIEDGLAFTRPPTGSVGKNAGKTRGLSGVSSARWKTPRSSIFYLCAPDGVWQFHA